MEKRLILFFLISFIIILGHSVLFRSKQPSVLNPISTPVEQSNPVVPIKEQTAETKVNDNIPVIAPEAVAQLQTQSQTIYLENSLMKIGISSLGASITECILKPTAIIRTGEYTLISQAPSPALQPLAITRFGDYGDLSGRIYQLVEQKSDQVVYQTDVDQNVVLVKTFKLDPAQSLLHLEVTVKNQQNENIDIFKGFDLNIGQKRSEGKLDQTNMWQINYIIGEGKGNFVKKMVNSIKERNIELGDIHWAGFGDKYFMTIVDTDAATEGLIFDRIALESIYYLTGLRTTAFSLAAQQSMEQKFSVYLGPKDLDTLSAVGRGYETVLGFHGFLGPITKILLRVLRVFYQWFHNYGLAIILLTIVIKILFFPLTHISFQSMKKMRIIQPKLVALREQYKDNPKKMQQMTMALYKENGVNPLSGCLPIAIQIPIFIAFYQLLVGCIELRGATFLWINNLSEADTIAHLGTIPINILPVLMGISMVWQQKMTPTPDPQQAKIMMFMPIVFTFLFYNLGSGLVLYWLVNNVISIGQQYWSQGQVPTPV